MPLLQGRTLPISSDFSADGVGHWRFINHCPNNLSSRCCIIKLADMGKLGRTLPASTVTTVVIMAGLFGNSNAATLDSTDQWGYSFQREQDIIKMIRMCHMY